MSDKTLIQLTNDTTPASTINTGVCDKVIAQATELILSRLAGRYKDVSSITPTPLLTMIAVDIATYLLYSRRNQGVIENVRTRYEDALEHLKSIQLNTETPPAITVPAQEYLCNKRKSDRYFNQDVWERY